MRRTLNGKIFAVMGLFLWVAVVRLLSGCSMAGLGKENSDKVRDLEFTVVGDSDVPQELLDLIQEKKNDAFKLTYSNDQGLYRIFRRAGNFSVNNCFVIFVARK